jgi:polar amino acid transport system substrate-binding protein
VDELGLLAPGRLTLLGASLTAPPYYWTDEAGTRHGYEADLAGALARQLGLELAWVDAEWADFYPALLRGDVDAIWSSQAITPERESMVAFSRPYGLFDEGVMVRAGSGLQRPEDFAGRRVGAIAGSTNLRTAQALPGALTVEFAGDTDDVFGDMIAALRAGEVDGFVDDEPPLQQLDEEAADITLGLVVPCANPYAIAVRPESTALLAALDRALGELIGSGELAEAWRRWFPRIAVPAL